MELLGAYRNGNYRTLIMDDGTKIRRTNDDDLFLILRKILISK